MRCTYICEFCKIISELKCHVLYYKLHVCNNVITLKVDNLQIFLCVPDSAIFKFNDKLMNSLSAADYQLDIKKNIYIYKYIFDIFTFTLTLCLLLMLLMV